LLQKNGLFSIDDLAFPTDSHYGEKGLLSIEQTHLHSSYNTGLGKAKVKLNSNKAFQFRSEDISKYL
jgi:hypothetical protein